MRVDIIDSLIHQDYLKTPRIIDAFRAIKREDFVPEEMKYQADLDAPLPIGWRQTISQPLTVAFMLELLQPEAGDTILDVGAGSGWTSALLGYIVSGGLKSEIRNPKPSTRAEPRSRTSTLLDRSSTELCSSAGLGAGPVPHRNEVSGAGSETNSKFQIQNSKFGKVYAVEIIPQLCEFGRANVTKYNFIERGIVEYICGDATKGFPQHAPFDEIHAAAAGHDVPQAWKDQLKVGGRMVLPIKSSVWLFIKKSENEFEEYEYPGFAFVPLIRR